MDREGEERERPKVVIQQQTGAAFSPSSSDWPACDERVACVALTHPVVCLECKHPSGSRMGGRMVAATAAAAQHVVGKNETTHTHTHTEKGILERRMEAFSTRHQETANDSGQLVGGRRFWLMPK